MDSNDLIKIILNIHKSLGPLQRLFTGLAYLLGIIFVFISLSKLHEIVAKGKQGHGENTFVPLAYLLAGSALLFLPSAINMFSVTVFGSNNVLELAPVNQVDVTSATIFMIRTAGVLWFIRGCVLLANASEPGVQEGPKGLVFLIAGVLAINFHGTAATINTLLSQAITITMAIKDRLGL